MKFSVYSATHMCISLSNFVKDWTGVVSFTANTCSLIYVETAIGSVIRGPPLLRKESSVEQQSS